MQAIDSARSLADALGRPLCVPWAINPWCGARFDQLFECPDVIGDFKTFANDRDADAFVDQHRSFIIDHYVPPFCDIPNAQMATSLGDIGELEKHPVIVIKSWARFHPTPVPFKLFMPIAALRDRIASVTATFDRTVGVHIRRTDHDDSRRESPTAAFVRLMQESVTRGDASDFFVATDDPAEEAELRRCFRIRSHPKRSLDRIAVEAIQDAVVDLFCLAATSQIIGSAGSTFSIVAADLSGVPLIVAR